MSRVIDDAGRKLRKIDRVFMVLTAKEGRGQRLRAMKAIFNKKLFPLDLLDVVDEKWRKGEPRLPEKR